MMGDHPDRQDMILSGDYPDPKTATMDDWSKWVEANCPFDPKWERWLCKRLERPVVGSKKELQDLRGVRDRAMAADLARMWFHLGTPQWERSYEADQKFKSARAAEEARRRAEFEQQEPQSDRRNSKRGRGQQWEDRA